MYVTSDGGSRTVPLSSLSFLSQTLSPLSCCEDLEPWQKSAGWSNSVSPTLGSTHKLSRGLHCVTAGSAAGTSVLKYGIGTTEEPHSPVPVTSAVLQHEALPHLYVSRGTISSKQAPACPQWCHHVSSHNQGLSGREGRAQPCSGGIKVPVMSTAASAVATSLCAGEAPGEVGMCLTHLPALGAAAGCGLTQEQPLAWGRWEAVSRQSPSLRQQERPEDEALFVVGLFSHPPPSHGMSALPSLCPRCKAFWQGRCHKSPQLL